MARLNGAALRLRETGLPDFTSWTTTRDKDWTTLALCVAALGFVILFTAGLSLWSDPSVNWDGVLSQFRLENFDV